MVKKTDKLRVISQKLYFYNETFFETFEKRLKDPVKSSISESFTFEKFLKTIGDLTLEHPHTEKYIVSRDAILERMKLKIFGKESPYKQSEQRKFKKLENLNIHDKINDINNWLFHRAGELFVGREEISRRDKRYRLLIFEAYDPTLQKSIQLYSDKYKRTVNKLIKKYEEENIHKRIGDEVVKRIEWKMDNQVEELAKAVFEKLMHSHYYEHIEGKEEYWNQGKRIHSIGRQAALSEFAPLSMASTDPINFHLVVNIIPFIIEMTSSFISVPKASIENWVKEVRKRRKSYGIEGRSAEEIMGIFKSLTSEGKIESLEEFV